MRRKDLLGKRLKRGGGVLDERGKSYDDGKSLRRGPDLGCLSVLRRDLSLCGREKSS